MPLSGHKTAMSSGKTGLDYRVVYHLHADRKGQIAADIPFTFKTKAAVRAILVVESMIHGQTIARARLFNVLP
jgi:hypothetical protein